MLPSISRALRAQRKPAQRSNPPSTAYRDVAYAVSARKAAIHPASTAVAAHRKAEWQKFQKLAQRKNLPIDIREKQMLQRKIAGLPVARFFASKTGAYRL